MPRAVVTISDEGQTPGHVDVGIEFNPPLKPNDPVPDAAYVAMGMVEEWMKANGRATGEARVNGKPKKKG